MSERHHFDVVVLGRGLIGSAIGKYLKLESPSLSVAVIGPDERQKQPTTDSHTSHTTKVYGAHYDEGRMTRLVDANPTWSYLAQESYKKYKDIESTSGITFFEQRGFLGVGEAFGEETSNGRRFINRLQTSATNLKLGLRSIATKTIVDEHKYLSLPEDAHCIWEDEAGVMNPRRLVAAQCKLFTQAGGVIIKSIVSRVEKQLDIIQLHTIDEAGAQSVITATKVICALGVYVNYVPGLLPTNSEIDVRVEPHTVVFFELTEKEAQRFSSMPVIILRGPTVKGNFYAIPPLRYPNGKRYLKLGSTEQPTPGDILSSWDSVNTWFEGNGSRQMRDQIVRLANAHFNFEEAPVNIHSECCGIESTSDETPMLGFLDEGERTFCITATNGYAAKSSDELARVAVLTFLHGKIKAQQLLSYPIAESVFTVKTRANEQ